MIDKFQNLPLVLLAVVVYSNLSNILIVEYGLPALNKFLIPLLALLVVYLQLKQRHISIAVLVTIVVALGYYTFQYSGYLHANYFDSLSKGLDILGKNLILMVVTAGLVTNPACFRVLTWFLILTASVISLVSITAFLIGDIDLNFGGFHRWKTNINSFGRIVSARTGGHIGDPNYYSQILLLVLPMGILMSAREKHKGRKIVSISLTAIIVIAIIFTLSRGAMLVLICISLIGFYMFLKSHKNNTKFVLTSLLIGVVLASSSAFFLPASVKDRATTLVTTVFQLTRDEQVSDGAVSGRIDEMKGAAIAFIENPIFGLGYNNYERYYQDFARKNDLEARNSDRNAHSLYLQLGAEGGIVGLIFFLSIIFVAVLTAIYSIKRLAVSGYKEYSDYIQGIVFGYLAYLAAAIFLHGAHQRYFWLFTGILIGTINIVFILEGRNTSFSKRMQADRN